MMNRSTIFDYFHNHTALVISSFKMGKGTYKRFHIPWDWESSFLLLNKARITDFRSVVLYSDELVVEFWTNDTTQINIKYRDIEYLEVRNDLDIGYMGLVGDKKVYHK